MTLDAAGFDQWYAAMADSPRRDEIVRRTLGLPAEMQSSSLLSWSAIADVVDALALRPGAVLVDLACGRGGYGLEIARRTGADLVGVDFSAVAIEEARVQAPVFGAQDRARFVVGDLVATGLPTACADALLCVDAIQFADPAADALAEVRRVLRPSGRAVLTCWEAVDRTDERIPERLRTLDLAAALGAAGFTGVDVVERPDWTASERALWEAVAATEPGDDPAMRSLHGEGSRVLPVLEAQRRVLAVATAP